MVPTIIDAVYKARTLQSFYNAVLTYDDWDICHDAGLNKNGNEDPFGAMEIDQSMLNALKLESIKLYPNPANKQLTIDYNLNEDETATLIICDIVGRQKIFLTLCNTKNREYLNVASLVSGVYTYKYLVNSITISSGKLIIE